MFGIGSVVGFILDDSHVKRQRLFLKRKKKEDIQGGVRLRLIGPSRITWIAKDVPGTEKRRRKTALPFLETLRPRVKILVETAMPLLYFSFSHYTHSLTANFFVWVKGGPPKESLSSLKRIEWTRATAVHTAQTFLFLLEKHELFLRKRYGWWKCHSCCYSQTL